MLEVLTRRYYGEHELHDVRTVAEAGRPFVIAEYTLDDRPTHLVVDDRRVDELAARRRPRAAVADDVWPRADRAQSVADLYLPWPDQPDPDADGGAAAPTLLAAAAVRPDVRRVAVAVAPAAGDAPLLHLPARDGAVAEERLDPRPAPA